MSKCTWHEEVEKSTNFFLNLEKKRALQEQIQKLIWQPRKYREKKQKQNELQRFSRNLFKTNCTKSYDDCKKFLDKITTPVLTNEKAKEIYEGDLVESELSNLLRSTLDCKSPGNDRLTKKFY